MLELQTALPRPAGTPSSTCPDGAGPTRDSGFEAFVTDGGTDVAASDGPDGGSEDESPRPVGPAPADLTCPVAPLAILTLPTRAAVARGDTGGPPAAVSAPSVATLAGTAGPRAPCPADDAQAPGATGDDGPTGAPDPAGSADGSDGGGMEVRVTAKAAATAAPAGHGAAAAASAWLAAPETPAETPNPRPQDAGAASVEMSAVDQPAADQPALADAPGPTGDGADHAPAAAPAAAAGPAGASEARAADRGAEPAAAPALRDLSAQIAGSLRPDAGAEVEITLSPAELGPLRMTLRPDDGTMTMVIDAERGETLDLLRRNIAELAGDLRDLGFGMLNFQFRHEGRDGSTGRQPVPPPAVRPDPPGTGGQRDSAVSHPGLILAGAHPPAAPSLDIRF